MGKRAARRLLDEGVAKQQRVMVHNGWRWLVLVWANRKYRVRLEKNV